MKMTSSELRVVIEVLPFALFFEYILFFGKDSTMREMIVCYMTYKIIKV